MNIHVEALIRWFRGNSRLLALAMLMPFAAAAAEASAAAATPRTVNIEGWLSLDAQGRPQGFEPGEERPLAPAMVAVVLETLEPLAFVPASRDGVAAASRSWLRAAFEVVPAGTDVALKPTSLDLGPRALPRGPLHDGWQQGKVAVYLVEHVVGVDGKPREVQVLPLANASTQMANRIRKTVLDWRFEPEQVAGMPVETTVRHAMTLATSTEAVTPDYALPEATIPAGRALAPDQGAYNPPLVLARVKRGAR